jgi:hypothetical protein
METGFLTVRQAGRSPSIIGGHGTDLRGVIDDLPDLTGGEADARHHRRHLTPGSKAMRNVDPLTLQFGALPARIRY